MNDVLCPNRALWQGLADRAQDFERPWFVCGRQYGAPQYYMAAYILVPWERVRPSSRLHDMLEFVLALEPRASLWLEDSPRLASGRTVKTGHKVQHLKGVLPGFDSSDVNPEYGRVSMRALVAYLDLVPFDPSKAGAGFYHNSAFVCGPDDADPVLPAPIVVGRRARRSEHRKRGLRRVRPPHRDAV